VTTRPPSAGDISSREVKALAIGRLFLLWPSAHNEERIMAYCEALSQTDAERLDAACTSIVRRWAKRSPPLPADLIEEIEAGKAAGRRQEGVRHTPVGGPFVALCDMAKAMGISHLSQLVNLDDDGRADCIERYEAAVRAKEVTLYATLPSVV